MNLLFCKFCKNGKVASKMTKLKRYVAVLLAAVLMLVSSNLEAFAWTTDYYIFVDPVANTYNGTAMAPVMIQNLQRFGDLPEDLASRDAVVRSGVFNLIKGDTSFRPNDAMTRQEALAFAVRAAGREADAVGAAARMADTWDSWIASQFIGVDTYDILYLGYMETAFSMGIISLEDYVFLLVPREILDDIAEEAVEDLEEELAAMGINLGEFADPQDLINFFRGLRLHRNDPVTREVFAHWLVEGITDTSSGAFGTAGTLQAVHNFSDWSSIYPAFLLNIERLARNNIMTGSSFRPRAPLTRMEAAMVGRDLDRILLTMTGTQRRTGTVGGIVDAQAHAPGQASLRREIRIRNQDGMIDVLNFDVNVTHSPQDGILDAVVLRNGQVGGLGSLEVGDSIEYIVHPASGTVLYVLVTGGLNAFEAMGRLMLINPADNTATFFDNENRSFTYNLAQGLIIHDGGNVYIRLGSDRHRIDALPYGSLFNVTLVNNIVTQLEFLGGMIIRPEVWGVVIANNPMLGYLVILDSDGHERTFNYNAADLRVQKTEYFDMRDSIGGIHSMFPDARFDPRETSMDAIVPGNIVSFRTDPSNPNRIISINASTNYTTRYGRIMEFRRDGDVHNFLMQFENGRTAWFVMPEGVMIRQGGRPIISSQVQVGDWARILINQAVVGPGHVLEAVRSMDIDVGGHHISNVLRGNFTGLDVIQNQLRLQNAQTLGPHGWGNYQQISNINITSPQLEFFHEGRPVTLAWVNNYLRFANAEVYIAMENHHGGERARMISFHTGRDELLNPETVLGVDGHGGFHIIGTDGVINTGPGTIVRRNGRLVDGRNIMPWDYALVSLNGRNNAAVVDIGQAPATAGVMIARGRVQSVDMGRSFRVQSISLFDGLNWHFTPIQREFTIDHGTFFFDESGLTSMYDFIDYTEDSVFDQVFNIVIDGSRAARVLDAPYATRAVRGTIFAIDGDQVSLRNVHIHDPDSGRWNILSNIDATGTVTLGYNSIIVDRNEVIGLSGLRIGDQIRVMTTNAEMPDRPATGIELNGYIALVER